LQQRRAAGAYKEAYKGIRLLETPCYQEFEVPLDDGTFGVIYVMPKDEKSYYVRACMPDVVSLAINAYVTMDSRSQQAVSRIYQETWPLLMDLRNRGASGEYSSAALTVVEDADDGVNRWSVTTIAGNVGGLSGVDILTNGRVVEAMARVKKSSAAVILQVSTSDIDGDRLSNNLRRSAVAAKLRLATKFVNDNFSPMVELIKVLDKND
jgi:hypothetical protein